MPGAILGDAHPGKPHNIVDGPDEMRRKVRELIRAGADVIKVCTSGGVLSPRDDPRHGHFRDDELSVLVAEATAAGQLGDGPRPGDRRHQVGDPRRHPLDRARHLPRRRGDRDDAEARARTSCRRSIAPMGVLEAADRGVNVPAYAIEKTKMVIETHRDSIRALHRRRRARRDGHRLRCDTARPEPPRARADGRLRDDADAGARQRRPARPAELMGCRTEVGTIEARQARRPRGRQRRHRSTSAASLQHHRRLPGRPLRSPDVAQRAGTRAETDVSPAPAGLT